MSFLDNGLLPVNIEVIVLIRAVLGSDVLHHHLEDRPPAAEGDQEPAGVQLVRRQLEVEGLVVDGILGVGLDCCLLLLDQSA